MENILLQLLIVLSVISTMQARNPCEGLAEGDECGTAGFKTKRCRLVPSCQGNQCLVCSPKSQGANPTCPEGSFICNDGGCIDIDRMCDSTVDCNDGTDEMNCNF